MLSSIERVYFNLPYEFFAEEGEQAPKKAPKKSKKLGRDAQNALSASRRAEGLKKQQEKRGDTAPVEPAKEMRDSRNQTDVRSDINYSVIRICYAVRMTYRLGSGQVDRRKVYQRGCLSRNLLMSLPAMFGATYKFATL